MLRWYARSLNADDDAFGVRGELDLRHAIAERILDQLMLDDLRIGPGEIEARAAVLGPAGPFHSITSSARASTVGGNSRPSALAVLRLITSSYLFGACTGRSAGFSPLRMQSTYSPHS